MAILTTTDSTFYNVQVEIYFDSAPTTVVDVLHTRMNPSILEELKGHGAGSFTVSKRDAKVMANPSLLNYRNIVKIRLNGTIIGAFIIQTKKTVIVGAGEEADEAWVLSGEGLRSASRDAVVYPSAGLKLQSAEERFFNFATEQGSWYNAGDWITPLQYGTPNDGVNIWATAPAEWPDAPLAQWLWGIARDGAQKHPIGFNYFRHEFTAPSQTQYSFFCSVDDIGEIYVDGELLLTTAQDGWTEVSRVDFALEAGPHVIGVKAFNGPYVTWYPNPGGFVGALFSVGDPDAPTPATLISYTGQSTWKVNPYPAVEPGWTVGDILLTLMDEASDRGVRFAQKWAPQFTADLDSANNPWDTPIPWSFSVGTTYEDVIAAVEELGCDVWIDPVDLKMYAWKKRGFDRTKGVAADPIILSPGHNLTSADETGQAQIANILLLRTTEGWTEEEEPSPASQTAYGRVESQLSTSLSQVGAAPLVTEVFRQKSLPETSATFEIVPVTGMIPFINFNVGDYISAPGSVSGVWENRRVMSISFTEEDETGAPRYAIEFDTIFKDRQDALEQWLSRVANSGAIGGGFTNSNALPTTTVTMPPGGTLGFVPDAPTGLIVSSVGKYTSAGESSTDYGLTWNAVSTGHGYGSTNVESYEVWGRKSTETEMQLFTTVYDTFAYLQGFRPGDTWVFAVRAVSKTGGPGAFSPEVALIAAAPVMPLAAPSTPTLTSAFGVVTVKWDGLIGGVAAPPYVRYLNVERKADGDDAYTSWAETRRNLFFDPKAVSLNSAWWTQLLGGFTSRTDMTGGITTAIRWTRASTGAARVALQVGTTMPNAGQTIRFQATVRSSVALTGVTVNARADVTSGTGTTLATINIPSGVSTIDVSGASFTGTAIAASGIALIIPSGQGSVGFTLDITGVTIELNAGSAAGAFHGDTTDATLTRYEWLGAPNASQSVVQTRTEIAWAVVGTILKRTYQDVPGTSGSTFHYRLTAVDTFGNVGTPSSSASIAVTGVSSGDITGGLASNNLVSNGSFEDDLSGWETIQRYNGTANPSIITSSISGAKSLRMVRGSETAGAEVDLIVAQTKAKWIPISPDGSNGYYVSSRSNVPSGTQAGGFSLIVYYYQSDKATAASTASEYVVASRDLSTTPQLFVGKVIPPSNAKWMRVGLIDAAPGATINVDDVVVREVLNAQQIADGAIAAVHMSAGSVTANSMAAESVTAVALAAGSVVADKVAAGAIQVSHLSSGVGSSLDISTNASVNILINSIDTVAGDLDETTTQVHDLTTYYSFGVDGAIIGKTDSAFKLYLKNDRIEFQENGIVVSYWEGGQMVVDRFVGTEVILGNLKIEKYGTGTIFKAV